jgi:hypothetical protein
MESSILSDLAHSFQGQVESFLCPGWLFHGPVPGEIQLSFFGGNGSGIQSLPDEELLQNKISNFI